MIDEITEIISEITGISTEELKNNIDKEDLWESFTRIEIIMELESKYNIRFTEDEIADMRSVNSILNITESRLGRL